MATYDDDRAAFVKNEYRRVIELKADVKARNEAAREVTVDSQVDRATAQAIATAYLNDNINPRVFEIEYKGIIKPEDLYGPSLTYLLSSYHFPNDGRVFKLIKATVDEEANTTVIQVRG